MSPRAIAWLIGFRLILALACTSVAPASSSPLPGTSAARTSEGSPSPTVVVGDSRLLLIATFEGEMPIVHVVDPETGSEFTTFVLPGWQKFKPLHIAGGQIFYDTDTGARRAKPGHPFLDLPFVQSTFLPTPDGQRIAWGGCEWDEENQICSNQIKSAAVDGGAEQILFEERIEGPVEAIPYAWSPDGRHLYVTHHVFAAEGGLFRSYVGLERVDTETREVVNILSGDTYSEISLSPDGLKMAYIPWAKPLEVIVQDLRTGVVNRAILETGPGQAGNIVWSPSGNELIVTHAVGSDAYSVILVDVQQMEQRILLESDNRRLRTIAWPPEASVFLDDSQYARRGVWRIDADGGEPTFVGPGVILGPMPAADVLPNLNPSALPLEAALRLPS